MLNFKEQAYMCEWIMGVFLILQELFLQGKDERGKGTGLLRILIGAQKNI